MAERFEFQLKKHDRRNLEAFCDAATAECRELRICREIANGSKHMGADSADPDVSVKVVWQAAAVPSSLNFECYLEVVDRGETMRAEKVFEGAFNYWERLFRELGYIEDRYIDGSPE